MEYLFKASVVIFIFYACYKLLLQRETFFESNRWFLITGLLIALFIPFIVIPIYIEYVPVAQNFIIANDGISTQTMVDNSFNLMQIIYIIYGVGVLFFLVKLCIEFSSLVSLLKKNKTYKKGLFNYIETDQNMPPFSFFRHIVYNKNQFNKTELEHILNHEKVHALQFHSIDILFIQIISTVFWFNPFIWLYKKEIQQNLEYIADNKAQTISSCEKSYQTLLLKASLPNYQFVLANNFYNSLIKKRIVMLHKSKSNKLNVWKYALVLPVLALFLMSVNTKEIYIEKAIPVQESLATADPSVENVFNNVLNSNDKTDQASISTKALKTTNTKNEQSKEQDPKVSKADKDIEMVLISKTSTDSDLEAIKNQLKEKGVTVKFKGIKRKSNNEITAIKIDVSSKGSNANYQTESDDPIKPINISIVDGKISIGNSNYIHSGDHAYGFMTKDGKHKVHSTGSDDNVFFFSEDDDDDEKVVIRKADEVHFSPKSTGKAHFISEDGKVTVIGGEHVVIRELESGKLDSIHVKKMPKGNAVWISKDDDGNVFKIKEKAVIVNGKDTDSFMVKRMNKGKAFWIDKDDDTDIIAIENGNSNKFFFSTDGKEPLLILNGKEISKKEMDELNSDTIEKVEVLKGDSATEKYGEKGKNGVVLITTKDKK